MTDLPTRPSPAFARGVAAIGRRPLALLGAAAALTLAAPRLARAQDALAKAKSAGVLHVASEFHFAPFDFTEGGKQVGLNADTFAEIGKELGVKVEFQDLPWESVLPGLDAGLVAEARAVIARVPLARRAYTLLVSDPAVAALPGWRRTSTSSPESQTRKPVSEGVSLDS